MKIKDLIMEHPNATDNELLVLFYEGLGYRIDPELIGIMCSKQFGITATKRRFENYNHLRNKNRQVKLL